MKIIVNNQTYENSTWLPGKDGIWIGGAVGENPIFGKNIPSNIIKHVYDKLKEQAEKHPDYVNIDEACNDVIKDESDEEVK